MARIELNEIAHSYKKNPKDDSDYALKHIHNEWKDGGAYALLGPSGCGKTTLLNVVSGLLTPSQGRVLYDGKDVTGLPPEKRNIAQVFNSRCFTTRCRCIIIWLFLCVIEGLKKAKLKIGSWKLPKFSI